MTHAYTCGWNVKHVHTHTCMYTQCVHTHTHTHTHVCGMHVMSELDTSGLASMTLSLSVIESLAHVHVCIITWSRL